MTPSDRCGFVQAADPQFNEPARVCVKTRRSRVHDHKPMCVANHPPNMNCHPFVPVPTVTGFTFPDVRRPKNGLFYTEEDLTPEQIERLHADPLHLHAEVVVVKAPGDPSAADRCPAGHRLDRFMACPLCQIGQLRVTVDAILADLDSVRPGDSQVSKGYYDGCQLAARKLREIRWPAVPRPIP